MSEQKYLDILSQLTLDEKLSLLSGKTYWLTQEIDRLGVPSVWMSDGPHGMRKEKQTGGTNIMQASETSTCFPTAVTTASSWDTDLLEEIGATIADEAKALKVTTVLGPGVNIKRSPLCGRNFEYISEDPFLTSRLGAAYVHGVQKNGVGVSLKHYCANNEEHIRMSIDSVVDERALREIYLSAFEHIVKKEQPTTIMCSYNRIFGTYLSDNKRMLTDILRDEWGFKGIVVSDWGAVNDRVEGIKAGLDLEMPGNKGMNNKYIKQALDEGRITIEDVDKIVLRMIKFAFECKANEGDGYDIDFKAHHETARKAATQSAVLLKNENGALPLKTYESVAVIGALADKLRYQGAGSSHINAWKTVSFKKALENKGQAFTYAPGYTLKGDGYNKKLIEEACEAAKGKEAVLVFIGLTDAFESEGFDRKHIDMPASHAILVEELSKVNDNIIVVLSCGSPIRIGDWEKKTKAILNMYLPGQAGGEAAYDLIYGKANPCGKLAETFPIANEDNIVSAYFPMGPRTVEYRESIYVGYRYFDKAKKAVKYPFGHGLSYVDFSYSDLKLSKKKINEGEELTVSFKVKNLGSVPGAEVAQLYVVNPESKIYKAVKELKGFSKVFLNAKEEKTVEITLDERAFSFYNVLINDWHAESGNYGILIGSSSQDIRLEGEVSVKTAKPDAPVPDYRESAPCYYNMENTTTVCDDAFVAVLDREIPDNSEFTKGNLTINSSVSQVAVSPFGKGLYTILTNGAKVVALTAENPDMITESIKDMPLRSFSGFTGGLLSPKTVEGILDLCNGTKGGFKKLISGFKK
ncbi:MAG: glycosyl hydrolase [Ruminococcaceae bacterium]|nr:glycosyl hydrolase [Oscillospiraceae bacterium]